MEENHKRHYRGSWITPEVLNLVQSKQINCTEALLLIVIDSLCKWGSEGCFASNQYLANQIGVGRTRTISEYVSHLIDSGVLRSKTKGRKRFLRPLWRENVRKSVQESGIKVRGRCTEKRTEVYGKAYTSPSDTIYVLEEEDITPTSARPRVRTDTVPKPPENKPSISNLKTKKGRRQDQDEDQDEGGNKGLVVNSSRFVAQTKSVSVEAQDPPKGSESETDPDPKKHPRWRKMADQLHQAIQSKMRIDHTRHLHQWAVQFYQLHHTDKVPRKEIKQTLKWYCGYYRANDDPYLPVCESGSSFRKKYLQVRRAMERNLKKHPDPPPRKIRAIEVKSDKPKFVHGDDWEKRLESGELWEDDE